MLSPTSCHQSQTLWALAQPRSLHFGPNELCTLRQYLSDECRARSLPIDCFLEVFSLSSHDWIMYSQFMWRLRDALLALGDQDQAIKYSKSLIHQILEALKTAVPTSVQEYLCHRGQFIRFLYSLAKRIPCLAFDCILHIFHSSSLCFPRLPALVDISFRLQTKSLVAYCKAHLLINENECEGQHLRLRMYSPQELYIFFKCLVLIAANEESYQLSQLCYTIMTPTSTMKNYSSRFSTPRVLKQEKRQWAKIRKIFLSHSTRSERKDEVRENTLPSPTELDIIVSPNFD